MVNFLANFGLIYTEFDPEVNQKTVNMVKIQYYSVNCSKSANLQPFFGPYIPRLAIVDLVFNLSKFKKTKKICRMLRKFYCRVSFRWHRSRKPYWKTATISKNSFGQKIIQNCPEISKLQACPNVALHTSSGTQEWIQSIQSNNFKGPLNAKY